MAGLDPSIYSQIQPTQSQPNQLAQLAQISQIQRYQMDGEKERRLLDMQDKRNAVLASPEFASGDLAAKQRALYGVGDIEGAGKIGTATASANKDTREAEKFKLESGIKQLELVGQVAGTVTDQQSYQRAIGILQQQGIDTSKFSPAYDPAGVKQFADAAMSRKDQMEQTWKAANFGLDVQKASETGRHNLTTEGIQADANAAKRGEVATSAAGKNRDAEMKLSDDYRAQSKDFKAVADAYRTINTTLDSATTSPAATLAGATKFMKLLDPGSVVRESELGMALQASGVIDRATNYINILQSGKVLTPTQVKDFKGITEQIYGAAKEGQAAVDADYTGKAEQYGLNPKNIIQDLGPKTKAEKSAAAAAPKAPAAAKADVGGMEAELRRRGLL